MIFTQVLVSVVYLLPVAVFLAARGRRDQSPWEIATDLVLAAALDLMVVLVLARVMRLEVAAITSRALWLGWGTAWWIRRVRQGDRPAWPTALDRQVVTSALTLAAIGLAWSFSLSRLSNMWDRDQHILLTASLRGQQMPFKNVYEPGVVLAYHYAGDALGAMFQTFSGARMHSALALSLCHDVLFALLGIVVSLALSAAGLRRVAIQAVVLSAILMAGPMMWAQNPRQPGGYSLGNMLSLSYRAANPLAFLLIFGFAAGVLAGVHREQGGVPTRSFPALAGIAALMVITDEITLVLLGVWLGVVWLRDPGALAETRRQGAIRLGLLVLAIIVGIALLGGTLAPGSERYPVHLIAPRAPGWSLAPAPLTTWVGLSRIIEDLLAILGVLVASVLYAVGKKGDRELRTIATSYAVIALVGTAGLTCLDFNGQPVEGHRWATLPFLLGPLCAAVMLVERRPLSGQPMRAAGIAALIIYVSTGLGIASSVDWMFGAPGKSLREVHFVPGVETDNLYSLDCRALTGAHLGERTAPYYAEARGTYLWSGCHPTFIAGPAPAGGHKIKTIGLPVSGATAFDDLTKNLVGPDDPVRVACVTDGTAPDPICATAQAPGVGVCKATGSRFVTCKVPAAQRARLAAAR